MLTAKQLPGLCFQAPKPLFIGRISETSHIEKWKQLRAFDVFRMENERSDWKKMKNEEENCSLMNGIKVISLISTNESFQRFISMLSFLL